MYRNRIRLLSSSLRTIKLPPDCELFDQKQLAWSEVHAEVFHFRTAAGREVDLVLEADDGRVVGIEVKAAASVGVGDFRGLEALREVAGKRFHRGVLLFGGREVLPFGKEMWVVPMAGAWQAGGSCDGRS